MIAASKIVHVHIPKTAGTSLRIAFERAYGLDFRLFPHVDEREYITIDQKLNFDPEPYNFFSGHIGFATASQLGGELITVLRNPADRYVSTYRFWRQLHEQGLDNSSKTRLAARFSLDEFAKIDDEPYMTEEFLNRMTWQLASGSLVEQRTLLRSNGYTDEDVFKLAKENLQRFSVVGFQEDMADFARSVGRHFGVQVKIEHDNTTDTNISKSDVSVETMRRILNLMHMDVALYLDTLTKRISHPN